MLLSFALQVLDWAMIALSFFNLIALLWLGLTILLNAERRTPGTWLGGGGLMLCGLLFVGHTALVGEALDTFNLEINFWWRVSWVLIVLAPFLWYLGTLWYSGVLEARGQRLALAATALLGLLALTLQVLDPLPSYSAVAARRPVDLLMVGRVPLVTASYPLYGLWCFGLTLVALYRPHASARFMGDLARTRARPWLIAATLTLSSISITFGVAMAWFLTNQHAQPAPVAFLRQLPLFKSFDLLLLILVAMAVMLTGQAIVSYEIFTGKTLPRGGLKRAWRRCLLLAAGYGMIVGLSLSVPLSSIYRVLLATVLMTLFYALLSWRAYAEREQSMDRLRPFVASQRLYERLLHPTAPPEVDISAPFAALCADVLDARRAYLVPLGPLAPLVGPAVVYPAASAPPDLPPRALPETLLAEVRSPQTMCVPLDPALYHGVGWAVPLWSERGLIGVILLGPKHDGSLYTQEEIEIARATGERLIDTQASAELARRLMSLQRQRLAESKVLDGRVRRVLHDDVLPRLHTAMLLIGDRESGIRDQEVRGDANPADARPLTPDPCSELAGVHRQIANLLYTMPSLATPEVARLGLIGALRQAAEGELANAFDGVSWQIEPEAERAAQTIPALTAEVVVYAAREAMRNAARYGRDGDPTRSLHLRVMVAWRDGLEVVIEDDGVGLHATAAQGHPAGSGQGLALHGTMMAVVGGVLTAETVNGHATRVSLTLPQSVCEGDPG